VSPRAKGRLVVLLLLAALVGFVVHSIVNAPPPDLMKVAVAFLRQQEAGTVFETVASPGAPLSRRWDPPSAEQATRMRLATLGKLERVVSSEPPEDVSDGSRAQKRVRARLQFEKKPSPVEAVFTFERVGEWRLADFHVPLKDPGGTMNPARLEELLRRSALEACEDLGRLRFDAVWRRLARAVRIAASLETWGPEMAAHVDGLGPFQRVEPGAWTPGPGPARGTLEARIVFEQGAVDVTAEPVFDGDEGRVVLQRFDPRR
jgi:hypothetical protein